MIQKKPVGTLLRGPFFSDFDSRDRPMISMNDESEEKNTHISEQMKTPTHQRDTNLIWPHLLPIADNNDIQLEPTLNLREMKSNTKSTKKRSLKFCRRLCKSILALLDREKFTTKAFKCFESIATSFLGYLDANIIDPKKFGDLSRLLFSQLWKRKRQMVTSAHNKKICLVTQNEWDSFFEYNEFVQEIETISEGLKDILELIDFKSGLSKDAFVGLYQRLLFILHLAFVNSVIHCELTKDQKFLERVPNYENFAMMAVEPWLYKHYNHSQEQFALECCGRCKVCRSGSIPPDFEMKLNISRKRFAEIKGLFSGFRKQFLIEFSDEEVSSIFVFCAKRHSEGYSLNWS